MTKARLLTRYVRCINNKAYVGHKDQAWPDYHLATLVVGQIYKIAPPAENDGDLLRVIDESGEDYLYPARYFEPYTLKGDEHATETITVHLEPALKNILRAEALAAHGSMSALLRAWIDERLDLPA
ncbi:MAG: hypothetical protein U0350_33535 [Caldilineaceae bacterium]